MNKILFFLLSLVSMGCFAQSKTIRLEGVDAKIVLADSPEGQRRTIVLCPGGGYGHIAGKHEGDSWVPFFTQKGISVAIVKYRLPHGDRNKPLDDVRSVFRQIYENAEEWNLNPNGIGIMGFSAGGHLASVYSNVEWGNLRPAFSVLLYPVINLESKPHGGMARKFLGENVTMEERKTWSSNHMVTQETPQTFIVVCDDDLTISPTNSIQYYDAMHKAKAVCELHIYPEGGHGYGFRDSFVYHSVMVDELSAWLERIKVPSPKALKVACIGNSITYGDRLKRRRVECYPSQLQELAGNRYWIRNFGVNGTTIGKSNAYMDTKQYQFVKKYQPDIVFIKLGTNDAQTKHWRNVHEFETEYQRMIDDLKGLASKPKIVLCLPVTSYREDKVSDSFLCEIIIPSVKKIAEHNGLDIIDLHTPTEGKENLFVDKLHPNKEGAKMIAEILADYLRA